MVKKAVQHQTKETVFCKLEKMPKTTGGIKYSAGNFSVYVPQDMALRIGAGTIPQDMPVTFG